MTSDRTSVRLSPSRATRPPVRETLSIGELRSVIQHGYAEVTQTPDFGERLGDVTSSHDDQARGATEDLGEAEEGVLRIGVHHFPATS